MSEPSPRPSSVRRKSAARLAALQTLFEILSSGRPADEAMVNYREHFLARLLTDFGIETIDDAHYTAVVFAVLERREAIDEVISPMLKEGWSLDRLSEVDRTALRCGYIELDGMADVPARAVVDEYTALADTCGGDHAFVNALLDRLARDMRSGEMAEKQ